MCSIFYSFSFLLYKFLDAKTKGEVRDCGYRTAKHMKNAERVSIAYSRWHNCFETRFARDSQNQEEAAVP